MRPPPKRGLKNNPFAAFILPMYLSSKTELTIQGGEKVGEERKSLITHSDYKL